MKEVKIIIIATIITLCVIISCAFATPVEAEDFDRGEFYPKLTVVRNSIRIESRLWAVECIDQAGNVWSFYDDEGTWVEGDIANLLMWALTEDPFEDEIVEVYWEGHVEDINEYRATMGWK